MIYAAESPSTWYAFEFDPEDSKRLRNSLTPLEAVSAPARRIDNPRVRWWPDYLSGNLEERRIQDAGYSLYNVWEPCVADTQDLLFFAVDWRNARGFFYRVAVSSNGLQVILLLPVRRIPTVSIDPKIPHKII